MLLWAVLTIIAVVVAAAMTVPLVRRYEARTTPKAATMAVLASSLAEVDAQAASGAVGAADAEALRTELKRRMLASGREPEVRARPLGTAALSRLAVGLAAFVAVAGTALYATLGRPDLAAETPPQVASAVSAGAQAGAAADQAATGDIASMVAQLETRMQANPTDPEGWRMLGWSYFQTSRFKESADAYAKAVAISPAGSGYASAYGEALVQAAGGAMTPLAVKQFEDAARLDKADARARYFLGVAKAEAGDRKGAIDDWLALLAEAPEGAEWATQVRSVIESTAQAAGLDVAARLAAVSTPAVSAPPNPSAEQVQSVQAMAPADQQAMIRSMVDSLAAKLKANPRDPAGWVRLMRARMVLGDAPAAGQVKRDALAALAGNAGATAQITQAATAMGVPE